MKLDPKFTKAIQNWLETPEDKRDIKAGAELLLALNRNRALYNSVMRRPEKFGPKVAYELRKHLRIRLDDMTVDDIVRMEAKLLPKVSETLAPTLLISPDRETPGACVARGRRPDHELLPPEIRDLWDSNEDRYRRINILFNELKAMHDAQPCDRYDKLVILDGLDKQYRKNLELYDSYVFEHAADSLPDSDHAADSEPEAAPETTDVETDNTKTVNAARKTLSKYRKQLSALSQDDPKRQTALEKIQAAVDAILASKAGVASETEADLRALGIKFE